MEKSEQCPLGEGSCIYTDQEVLDFLMKQAELPEECMTVFCPHFRGRLIRLIREDESKKPVISLKRVRQAEELEENIDFIALGMFG